MEAFNAVLPQKLPLQLDTVFGDVVDLRARGGGSTFLLWGDDERGEKRVRVLQVNVVARVKRGGGGLDRGRTSFSSGAPAPRNHAVRSLTVGARTWVCTESSGSGWPGQLQIEDQIKARKRAPLCAHSSECTLDVHQVGGAA